MSVIDGPRLHAQTKPAKHLVVLLHGYGADGRDLIGLAPLFQDILPDAEFVSPDAPEPCDGNPFGRQWFGLGSLSMEEITAGAKQAAPILNQFLDEELAKLGITDDGLILLGFSQGAMMALEVGLRRAKPPLGILAFSTALPGADRLAQETVAHPPVLLVHGDADEMVPIAAFHHSRAVLGAAGIPLQWHVSPGVGHGIAPDAIERARGFIQGLTAK